VTRLIRSELLKLRAIRVIPSRGAPGWNEAATARSGLWAVAATLTCDSPSSQGIGAPRRC